MGSACAIASAACRSRSCWLRRASTPSTAFLSEPIVADGWAAHEETLSAEPVAAATYLPGGRPPIAGDDLPESRPGPVAAARWRRAARTRFYRGPDRRCHPGAVARAGRHDGRGRSRVVRAGVGRRPSRPTYRGWTVYELPPNTQGIAALMMLNLMEQLPLARYGFHSTDALHVMIEAKKLAYADMLRWVGDPRFAAAPVAALLDKARAARRAALNRHGPRGRARRAGPVGRPDHRAPAATPSTCPRSIATATSCR